MEADLDKAIAIIINGKRQIYLFVMPWIKFWLIHQLRTGKLLPSKLSGEKKPFVTVLDEALKSN
jgi:hypothetical protein